MSKKMIVSLFILNTMFTFSSWSRQAESGSGLKEEAYSVLVKKNLELREKLDVLFNDYEGIKGIYSLLIEKVKTLQNEREELTRQKEQVEILFAGYKQETEKLTKELSLTKEKLAGLDQYLDRLKKENQKLTFAGKKLPGRMKKTETVISNRGKEIEALKIELGEFRDKDKEQKEKITALSLQLEILRKDSQSESLLAENTVKAEYESKLKSLQLSYDQQREELSKLEKSLKDLEGRKKEKENELTALIRETDNLRQNSEKADKQRNDLLAQTAKLKNINSKLILVKQALREERISRQKLKTQIQDERGFLTSKIDNLEKQTAALTSEKIELVKSIGKIIEDKNNLKKELSAANEKFDSFEKDFIDKNKQCQMKDIKNKAQHMEIVELCGKEDKIKKQAELAIEAQRRAEKVAKKAEEKMTALEKSINKERTDMHYNLGVVFFNNNLYKDAEREYLKCMEINNEDADAHYNLGILYDYYLNDNKRALEHYNKYLEFTSSGEETRWIRERLLYVEEEIRLGTEVK